MSKKHYSKYTGVCWPLIDRQMYLSSSHNSDTIPSVSHTVGHSPVALGHSDGSRKTLLPADGFGRRTTHSFCYSESETNTYWPKQH